MSDSYDDYEAGDSRIDCPRCGKFLHEGCSCDSPNSAANKWFLEHRSTVFSLTEAHLAGQVEGFQLAINMLRAKAAAFAARGYSGDMQGDEWADWLEKHNKPAQCVKGEI